MNTEISIQVATDDDEVPPPQQLRRWATAALMHDKQPAEVCIRIVDQQESQHLNQTYRQKPYPTNVLSFPAALPDDIDSSLLGDVAICATIVKQEAMEQHKAIEAHWCHMVVHGLLHLQGFDHCNDDEAAIMEALETKILTGLAYPPPYDNASEQLGNACISSDITETEGDRQSE